MNKGVRIRIVVGVLVAALVVYFWLLADRAVALIALRDPLAGIALGIGVLLLPIIGVVLVG